jgi:hypothetical protein
MARPPITRTLRNLLLVGGSLAWLVPWLLLHSGWDWSFWAAAAGVLVWIAVVASWPTRQ